MLKLLAFKRMKNFQFHPSYDATLPEKRLTTKMNDSLCCLSLTSASFSENSQLEHDGNQQRSIANVQNDGQL